MKAGNRKNLLPPCGMYCGECKAYVEGECGGCGSGIGIAAEFSGECKICLCAKKRRVDICLECKDFPCRHMDYFCAKKLRESAWYSYIIMNMREQVELGDDETCKKRDAALKKRIACAKKKGVPFCDTCDDWPCALCRHVPLISEPDVPP